MFRFAASVLVVTLSLLGSSASAEMIGFRLDGVVDSVGPNLGSRLQAGDPWSLTFMWEARPNDTEYPPTLDADGNLGDFAFGLGGRLSTGTTPAWNWFAFEDHYDPFVAPRLGANQEFQLAYANIYWQLSTLAGLAQTVAPPSGIPGNVTNEMRLVYINFVPGTEHELDRGLVTGHVTSMAQVPEPTTLLLTLMGFGGALVAGRRGRASKADA